MTENKQNYFEGNNNIQQNIINGDNAQVSQVNYSDRASPAEPRTTELPRIYVALGLGMIVAAVIFIVFTASIGLNWYGVATSIFIGLIAFVSWMASNPKYALLWVSCALIMHMIAGDTFWQFVLDTAHSYFPEIVPKILLPPPAISLGYIAVTITCIIGAVIMYRSK